MTEFKFPFRDESIDTKCVCVIIGAKKPQMCQLRRLRALTSASLNPLEQPVDECQPAHIASNYFNCGYEVM